MTHEIFIPFAGFYESIHNDAIESCIMAESVDDNGDIITDRYDKIYELTDFKLVHNLYAKKYVENLVAEINTINSLTFKSLISPKYYNFETDRILASISYNDIDFLFSNVTQKNLQDFITKNHSSCSGFHSFYSNELYEWRKKPISMWDCNQLGTLLECFLSTHHNLQELEVTLSQCNLDWIYCYLKTE